MTGSNANQCRVKVRRVAWFLTLASALALVPGCQRNPYEDLTLDAEERIKVVKLHGLFKDRRVRVGAAWLAAEGCAVYRSVEEDATIVAWEVVGLPHQGFDVSCNNGMSMAPELDADGFLQFGLCSRSLLLGSCAARGRYRTRNAIDWDCQVEVPDGEATKWARCDAARAASDAGPDRTTPEPVPTAIPAATEGPVALTRQRALVRLLEAHAASGARLAQQPCVEAPCLLHDNSLDPCSVVALRSGESYVAAVPIVMDEDSARERSRRAGWPRSLEAHGCLLRSAEGSRSSLVLAWNPPEVDTVVYVQSIPVEERFEVCGAGCAKYSGNSLWLTAESLESGPGGKRKQRQLRLSWAGNSRGMGKFVVR